ncbi:MAG: hypothetical protein IEMM0002_0247 [bacterium]|nr:MAG: hypothetical protein IEMM0002_0247 [bacterium]
MRMFVSSRWLFLLAVLVTPVTVATAAHPQGGELISVYAEGVALVENDDRLAARESAHEKAIAKAFISIVRSLVPAYQINENRYVIEALLETRGMDFVQSYKFTEEPVNEDSDVYKIGMQVTFFYGYLRGVLIETGFEMETGTMPKVVLLIDERAISVMPDSSFLLLPSATEENVSRSISQLGFFVVNRGEIRKLGQDDRVLKAVHGDPSSVLWLGEIFDADYVITGSARSVAQSDYDTDQQWVEGEIDAAIYDGRNADVLWEEKLAERVEGGEGAAGFSAIRMAGEKFNRKVVEFMYGRAR